MSEPRALTPVQVAQRLGLDRKTVYRWIRAGWLEGAVQLPNGRWRIPADVVEGIATAGAPTEAAS